MTEDSLPELNETSLALWLSCLADRELNPKQRTDLMGFLEQHPEHWRSGALALWDAQWLEERLAETLPLARFVNSATDVSGQPALVTQQASIASSPPQAHDGTTGDTTTCWRFSRRWVISLSLALAALLAIASGWWTSWQKTQQQIDELRAELQDTLHYVNALQGTLLAEQVTFRSLRGVFPDHPCLIEIESTPDRVLYLTDGQVSDDLLRGLVNLGQVQVRPYEPLVETSLWRSLGRPVVAIEVSKDSYLLAQGEL